MLITQYTHTFHLQDIKLPDAAGGYVYSNPDSLPLLANRTLYWRTMGDLLELSEVSLNFDLIGNKVLYRFQVLNDFTPLEINFVSEMNMLNIKQLSSDI